MEHVIRPIRAEEWRQVRDLRLDALRDPVAALAFLDTYEAAAARPDSYWEERAAGSSEGTSARQFVAEARDGSWDGTITVLVERAGTSGILGDPVAVEDQGHLVGVFVRPGARGTGITEALFAAAVEWARSLGLERVRLFVHEDNARARAFYVRYGFEPSGVTVTLAGTPEGEAGKRELEMVLTRR